jgi:predicted transposase YbfD/YdcC
VHLFAAMVHKEGVVTAQREVCHTTNEITELRGLLEDVDLDGAVVTANALHTQRDHANFLVEEKGADYVLTVKGNQPGTLQAVQGLFEQGCLPPVAYRG